MLLVGWRSETVLLIDWLMVGRISLLAVGLFLGGGKDTTDRARKLRPMKKKN